MTTEEPTVIIEHGRYSTNLTRLPIKIHWCNVGHIFEMLRAKGSTCIKIFEEKGGVQKQQKI